jgi:hypothetical protein
LLANIMLHELDKFVEDELIPKYTIGKSRAKSARYRELKYIREKAKQRRQKWIWDMAGKEMRKIPRGMGNDPSFKRLKYVRYADDSLLALIGTKRDAEMIKQELKDFLKQIGLEMSEAKTLITHAGEGKARFLNYLISVNWNNTKQSINKKGVRMRSINGDIVLEMPADVYTEWKEKVQGKDGKVMHRAELLSLSDYDIVSTYEVELQGLINYYTLAHNVYKKGTALRYSWLTSLTKTLAGKHKTRRPKIYRKYHYRTEDGRNTIAVVIKREGKNPLQAVFGRKKIERKFDVAIDDTIKQIYVGRTQLVERMLADTCELCGSRDGVEVHHIKKLKDLQKKWQGRKEKPDWVKTMIAIRRKTLVVCKKHHDEIHSGHYDGEKLA